MRINKFLAHAGVSSRRQADEYIKEGRVSVNGELVDLAYDVKEDDIISFDGKEVKTIKELFYIKFNKPAGVITSGAKDADNSYLDYIKIDKRYFSVGRLDVASTGLLLLTNDGDYANLMQSHEVTKEYIVKVTSNFTDEFLEKIAAGVKIPLHKKNVHYYYKTKPCKVYKLTNKQFGVILKEGKNQQIRKMCKVLGYSVDKLNRIRVGRIKLGSLPAGKWEFYKK